MRPAPLAAADPAAVIGLLVTLALWIILSVAVVVNRVLYERRQRRLIDIARQLTDPSVASLPPLDRSPAIRRILSRRSRREVYRLVASLEFPVWLTEICAVYCLEYVGVQEMRRDASARHGRKWRRVSALIALGHIRATDVHALLGAAVCEEDPEVATAAAKVLFRIGDRAAAIILVSALRRASVPTSRVASYLDRFPIPIDDLLLPLLRDPRPRTRYWAASLLGRYPSVHAVVPEVAALLRDPDASVRKAALTTLGAAAGPQVIEYAEPALSDPVGYVRSTAIRAISEHASAEKHPARRHALASAIAPLLGDPEWEVRLAAKESLVRMGQSIWRAVAVHLESSDRFARNGAAEVLQNLCVLDWALQFLANGVELSAELHGVLARAFQEGGTAMVEAAAERTGYEALADVATTLPGVRFIGQAS